MLRDWAMGLGYGFEPAEWGGFEARQGRVSIMVNEGTMYDGTPYIGVDGRDERDGYEGVGIPCRSYEEAEREVHRLAEKYGMEGKARQLSLF